MRIAIDTNILIWGIRQAATVGQEAKVDEAGAFLEWAAERGDEITVPATAISEYLVGEPAANHPAILSRLAETFRILPFDLRAVSLAARLRQDPSFLEQQRAAFGTTRVHVKADIEIVATAKACGAEKLFSNDKQLRHLAHEAKLPASPLPGLAVTRAKNSQPSLLDADGEE